MNKKNVENAKRVEIPKAYFGKFQPDIYLLFTYNPKMENLPSPSQNKEKRFADDILVQFKEIDEEFHQATFLVSGKVRFSIRGFFITNDDKKWFIPNTKGPHLLTCVWASNNQLGIDTTGCQEKILFQNKKWSSSGNTSYSYIITLIENKEWLVENNQEEEN